MTFVPITGAVVDRISRRDPLTEREQRFADWAASRGLAVLFSRCYPLEDDEEQFEPFLTYELVVEEFVNDKILCYRMTVEPTDYAPQREVLEELLRAGFERYKREAAVA